MIQRKIGFIGAGFMAEALARGILRADLCLARDVFASDPSEARRKAFSEMIGPNVFAENARVAESAEVLILAVKPHVMLAVAEEIQPALNTAHLIVSIAPGVTLGWLRENLGTGRVVRVMPNTPALLGAGAAAYCAGPQVSKADKDAVEAIFSAVGICIEVEERHMDAVTGLSGSGPAYVYVAIEALSDGGVKMGLPRAAATRLAAQTVLGAARMVLETNRHPAQLKDQVTTPGGTTIEGLHALEKAGVRRAFMDAVEAAALKSRELGASRKPSAGHA